MLIIFLGLIATLTSVSGECVVGKQDVKNFDFTRAAGNWYVLKYTPNVNETNYKCVVATYKSPEGNISPISVKAYVISQQAYVTVNGNLTDRTNNAFDELFQIQTIWNGRYYVIATDYDRYIILKLCSFETNELYVYVAYRSNRPDAETVRQVKKESQENNIDYCQLADWPADHC